MAEIRLYHNPRCSKSRGALEILNERGVDADVVEYLADPPDRETLAALLAQLADPPAALVRRDKNFDALGLDPAGYQTAEEVIDLLVAHPELMQRPVVVRGGRALIARPSERVLELL